MKKTIIASLLCLVSFGISAQNLESTADIPLKTKADYDKNEPTALKCAEYLLNHEVEADDQNSAYAMQFMMRWMEGTEITFELGEDFLKYSDGDNDRTGLYLASLVYVALKHPETQGNTASMNEKANEVFLNYCAEHKSLKRNKAIKQELKAMDGNG